jgi:hypothetical protein
MELLDTRSLAGTIDAVNDALFFGGRIPKNEARRTALWLAGRQGLPKSYAGMFAPTDRDYAEGIRLFTGERITSGAATAHILGEETCRVLLLLEVDLEEASAALVRATHSMDDRLSQSESERGSRGFFCCGSCTASLWRHLAAGGLTKGRERLAAGVNVLKEYRNRDGGWRRFPFYYTLLALTEMNGRSALEEMRYAAPRLEQMLKRRGRGDRFDMRRRAVAERILARV